MNAHRLSFVLLLLCFASPCAFAKDPIPVAVSVAVVAGDLGEAEVIVENTTDTTVTVALDAVIEYADGTEDQLSRVKNRHAFSIEPGQGFILSLLFFVPADSVPEEATFTAAVRVTDVSGEANGSFDKRASESATFEVVEP